MPRPCAKIENFIPRFQTASLSLISFLHPTILISMYAAIFEPAHPHLPRSQMWLTAPMELFAWLFKSITSLFYLTYQPQSLSLAL